MATTPDSVVDQVKAQVKDTRVRLAMLVGSLLEGGWGPTFGVGDSGHSHGPFQINDLYHSDITTAQAEDPASAVAYMRGSYASAVGKIPAGLWSTDPELAAQQAAQLAERPAQPYNISEGQSAVDAAYGKARNALGVNSSGWSLNPITDAGKVASGIGGIFNKGENKVAGAVSNVVAGAFGAVWNDAKPFLLTMAFAGLGLGLIAMGGYQATKGKAQKTVEQFNVVGGSGGGKSGGGAPGEAAGGAGAGVPAEAAAAV